MKGSSRHCMCLLVATALSRSWTLLALLVLALSLGSGCASPERAPPNIVFILADDMGYGDPGSYNPASRIPTPNIDRLAAEGLRFTDAHTPSAVCSPTRYGILTGRYAWRTALQSGVLWGYSSALIEEGRLTVASLLRRHGYRTAAVGKWHLGLGSGDRTDYSGGLDFRVTDEKPCTPRDPAALTSGSASPGGSRSVLEIPTRKGSIARSAE